MRVVAAKGPQSGSTVIKDTVAHGCVVVDVDRTSACIVGVIVNEKIGEVSSLSLTFIHIDRITLRGIAWIVPYLKPFHTEIWISDVEQVSAEGWYRTAIHNDP